MAIRCASKPVMMSEERGICKLVRLACQNFRKALQVRGGLNRLAKPKEAGKSRKAN